jgi:hypothetical protein
MNTAKVEAMEASLAMKFFRFMGISGWLWLLLVIVSGTAFAPSQFGGHDLLYFQWALGLAIWLCARWGTHFKERFHKSKA